MDDIDRKLASLPDKTYFRIGEVAQITSVKPYVLRFWESEFQMMAPPKSRSKQRMYRKKDIQTILLIKKLLYDERFTIDGARKRMSALRRAEKQAPTKAAPEARVPFKELQHLRTELNEIRELLIRD